MSKVYKCFSTIQSHYFAYFAEIFVYPLPDLGLLKPTWWLQWIQLESWLPVMLSYNDSFLWCRHVITASLWQSLTDPKLFPYHSHPSVPNIVNLIFVLTAVVFILKIARKSAYIFSNLNSFCWQLKIKKITEWWKCFFSYS